MRVLMINNRPPHCGIGEYTYSIYRALHELMGEDVELLSWQSKFLDKFYARVRERHFLQYPEEALRISSQIVFLSRLPRGYSVYHFTNSAQSFAVRWAQPCVVTVHDLIPFTSPRDLTDRLIRQSTRSLKHARRIICVSKKTRDDLLQYLDVDPSRVRVIYEGVNPDEFHPGDKAEARSRLGLPQDRLLVLHVGSEEPRKDLPTLVAAFHKMQKDVPDALLIRVGEKTEAVQRVIGSLGLEEKVRYFQGVAELGSFYNAADVLAFPSLEEGFGFPPLQAMASGCPVVASNSTSIPEVVGDAGILVDPQDANNLALHIAKVCGDKALRSSLIEKGLERSRLFSWDRFAAETLEVYREAAA